jgi:hypothetical protein
MNLRSRLRKVALRLTPQQAALFWLKETQRTGSFAEYQRRVAKLPLAQFPRTRINRQITVAVREALKGQPPDLIRRTMRSAAIHADFLIMLILELNKVVLCDAECRRLRLQLLIERMQHRAQEWTDDEYDKWICLLLLSVGQVLALKSVIRQIQSEHFSNTNVLFGDASQVLQREFALVHRIFAAYNEEVAGCPDAPFDLKPISDILKPGFVLMKNYICAKAKSDTLVAFSRPDAAADLMRPYWNRSVIPDLWEILQ